MLMTMLLYLPSSVFSDIGLGLSANATEITPTEPSADESGVYQIMEAGEERLADVVLYGHTHRQQIDEGGEGCPTAFNPGSLGFGGQYGVIECRDGEFTIQECRVPAAERG